jgi:hypothetical protein
MGAVGFVLLVLILVRVSSLASAATISREELLECLRRMDAPAVLVTQRTIFWLIGAARYRYTCVYKGHQLHLRSFSPIELPVTVDTIRVQKW